MVSVRNTLALLLLVALAVGFGFAAESPPQAVSTTNEYISQVPAPTTNITLEAVILPDSKSGDQVAFNDLNATATTPSSTDLSWRPNSAHVNTVAEPIQNRRPRDGL